MSYMPMCSKKSKQKLLKISNHSVNKKMTNAIKKSILCFTMPLLVATTQSAQANLLTANAGFEDGGKGWFAYGDNAKQVSYTAEAAKSGKLGLNISSKDEKTTQLFLVAEGAPVKTEAGKKYKLTYWVKPTEKGLDLRCRIYEGKFSPKTGVELDFSAQKMTLNEWQQVSLTFKGAALAKGKISILVNRGACQIDDIEITEEK